MLSIKIIHESKKTDLEKEKMGWMDGFIVIIRTGDIDYIQAMELMNLNLRYTYCRSK